MIYLEMTFATLQLPVNRFHLSLLYLAAGSQNCFFQILKEMAK